MGALIQYILKLLGLNTRSIVEKLVKGALFGKGSSGGGLGAMVEQFKNKGLGSIVNSWVGSGPNQPISPDQVKHVVGDEKLNDMAKEANMPPDTLAAQLAKYLPGIIDKMTPGGKVS